ncbi:RING-H2 finger protein ATL16-like [Cornus florida]|uniref:RING-H2 finger protein ATL16-like n=1 Tax=Cornus florida TaxID=4283 RepID=UPI00289E3238|nr:RING-H2 finger protein ATL16-like [Cornus florida]
MSSIHRHIFNNAFQDHPPIKTQTSTYQPPLPTSDTGFPILAIAVLCIMATAFLLVSYYIFVSKCCLNWQQLDPLQRFSMSRARRSEDPLMAYSPSFQNRGLDELLINEIPTFQYIRGEGTEDKSLCKCVVCLNEFQEQDVLRVLPSCSHAFHLDCIDIWLQSNANCPLCRSSISGTTRHPIDRIVAPTSSPQDPQPFTGSLMGSDEDFVVIELSGENETVMLPHGQQEREDDSRVLARSRGHSPRKVEQKSMKSKPRKFNHVSIMGDECIDVRERDDQFSVQPIRRSFSMDSAADRHIYLSVQEIIRQNRQISKERNSEECSSRVRRSIFPFRHGGGSRSAVLPIESDL